MPLRTTRSNEASKVSISRSLPYSCSGIRSRSGCIVFAEREVFDPALRFPFGKAVLEVTLEAGCGLVALFGRLGEQLHDDRRDGARHPLTRSAGGIARLAMWQCTHSIGSVAVNGSAPVSIW